MINAHAPSENLGELSLKDLRHAAKNLFTVIVSPRQPEEARREAFEAFVAVNAVFRKSVHELKKPAVA